MARFIVAAAVGVVAGVATGNPGIGFQAFAVTYGVTGFLDPAQKFAGPRLDDLKITAGSYGSPIAYCEGNPRLAGALIWASDKREIATTTEVGGKGGPSAEQTTYTYEMDGLYLLSINPQEGVRRIWIQGELVWTAVPTADSESLAASAATDKWRALRVYTGASNQLPDPTYEAAVGVGNAPAYRGRLTVFIEGLQLYSGGQVPLLTFEIGAAGSAEIFDYTGDVQTSVAPALATSATAIAWGGGGGGAYRDSAEFSVGVPKRGGGGGYASRTFAVTGGESLSVFVAGGGKTYQFDGNNAPAGYGRGDGGAGPRNTTGGLYQVGGAGGGGSAIYRGATLLIAAGGGGGGGSSTDQDAGAGGGSSGGGGTGVHGAGATQTDVGEGGNGSVNGGDGTGTVGVGNGLGGGGAGNSNTSFDYPRAVGGAGGGGYLGGGGGAADGYESGSGGGGSGYAPSGTLIAGSGVTPGNTGSPYWGSKAIGGEVGENGGDGRVAIIYGIETALPTLAEVITRLVERTGLLTASQIDVTALTGIDVRAMAVSQVTPTRSVLQSLMQAYLVEAVESEGKIKFVIRGGSPALTLDYEDLGATSGEPVEPLPIRRLNDIELPSFVTVKFANTLNDYQDGSESGDRLITQSTSTQLVEIPLGLTPQEAKRIADVATMDLAVSILSVGPLALTREHAALEPTDVILVTGPTGSTYRVRILKITDSGMLRTLECVLDDATAVNSVAETDEGYTSSSIVRAISASDLELLDIPILRDADDTPGIYAAAKPIPPGRWPGAALARSPDDISYTQIATFAERAVIGETTTVLADFAGGYVYDLTSSVTVDVGEGTISGTTRAAIDAGTARPILIGAEIIFALTATNISPGVYKLTNLLRGLQGTEHEMAGHATGERVVVLQPTGLRRIEHQVSDVGLERHYKAVSFGKSFDSTESEAFTDTGIALRPYSPTNARVARDGSNNATVTWSRRTRLTPRYGGLGGSVIPLGEAVEAYSIDFYEDDTFTTIVRTEATTAETYTYSAANQTSDGLTPGDPISFRVYQLSATVGRGIALEATA